jgi:gas vesicle protein
MRTPNAFLLMCISCGLLFTSCSGHRTPETVHTLKQSERENRIDDLLKEYHARIDELDRRSAAAADDVRKRTDEAVKELKRDHREAAERLEQLRESANSAWGDANTRLQESLDRLKNALDRALNRPGDQPSPTP